MIVAATFEMSERRARQVIEADRLSVLYASRRLLPESQRRMKSARLALAGSGMNTSMQLSSYPCSTPIVGCIILKTIKTRTGRIRRLET